MLHLFYDSQESTYLLLKTKGAGISDVYYNDDYECWLPLAGILTATSLPENSPENFHSFKEETGFDCVYSHRTLSGIHHFILTHPELLI